MPDLTSEMQFNRAELPRQGKDVAVGGGEVGATFTAASRVVSGAKRRLEEVRASGARFADEENHLRRLIADYGQSVPATRVRTWPR
jgi:hypothetical protein